MVVDRVVMEERDGRCEAHPLGAVPAATRYPDISLTSSGTGGAHSSLVMSGQGLHFVRACSLEAGVAARAGRSGARLTIHDAEMARLGLDR